MLVNSLARLGPALPFGRRCCLAQLAVSKLINSVSKMANIISKTFVIKR